MSIVLDICKTVLRLVVRRFGRKVLVGGGGGGQYSEDGTKFQNSKCYSRLQFRHIERTCSYYHDYTILPTVGHGMLTTYVDYTMCSVWCMFYTKQTFADMFPKMPL